MTTYKTAFTVDVEDGVSLAMRDAFSNPVPQTDRVLVYTTKTLDLCRKHNVKGTFFVLGEVAEKFPQLIKAIAGDGHELGVHGFHHLQFFDMTEEKAYQELSSAKKLIEDISGEEVKGHRAPVFSITPETKWGLDVIARAGFTYDSSIMPIKGTRYGWPGFPKEIQKLQTPSGLTLMEAPMSTINLSKKEIPVAGGGYLRMFPLSMTRRFITKIIQTRPAIIYLHPYELDFTKYPDYYFEELKKTGLLNRLKMKAKWWNRKTIYPKLDCLMEEYDFETLGNLVDSKASDSQCPLITLT